MFGKKTFLGSLAAFGLLLGTVSGTALAEMPASSSAQTSEFRRIEQPLALKVGVAIAGLGLIGLELWWFLLSKSQAHEGIQELTITVDSGYQPARVVVKAGQPVRLNFLRRDPNNCLEKVLLPDFQIASDLALNRVTSVEFTPLQPGEYQFTCGMNMFRGVVEVQE
ncbi:cupredoxin domain-containing protein [Nostocaceae cyanobacterium CENA369]|uniref:Cupredoxin domain-containing protein n=1 Tax=Dendronalium phyllosphericum CENA369 TaxID=1725256 RepID=A0A8J7IMK7_9NOST|nr:cupredoxin domain-containing protein [Dendronalium phyllosphericum]MBH8577812.1 cupredoxin domain-containing protein [Dendronalium phyllosphericum CENA369]